MIEDTNAIEPPVTGRRVEPIVGRRCSCPVVEIYAMRGQVSEEVHRQVADLLHASVELKFIDGRGGGTKYGKHRDDCPCGR